MHGPGIVDAFGPGHAIVRTIMPVADLRNYGEVLNRVKPGVPVLLTRNGRGRYAVLNIEAARALAAGLDRACASAAEGTASFADARAHLAERMSQVEP